MNKFGELNSKEKKDLTKVYNKLLLLKEKSYDGYFDIKKLEASVLASLLLEAIDKIDYLQNVASCDINEDFNDPRDWKDRLCDKEFIFAELVNDAVEFCKLLIKEN